MPDDDADDAVRPGLFARALIAFLALPGMVGYAIPIVIGSLGERDGGVTGLLVVGVGSVLLLWCVVEFYRAGRGTLAPWAPARNMVVTGPYKWSRNPMYIAVVLVILGWALWFGSRDGAIYLAAVAVAFHFRVTLYEEPRIAAQFPADWPDYARRVRRWL